MSFHTVRRAVCRAVYLLPLLLFATFCIYAAIPHVWFVYDGEAHATLSLFELQANTWESCEAVRESADANAANLNFANLMTGASILFWGALVLLGIFSVTIAVCSLVAFSQPPASKISNRTKRISGLLCPNRIGYLLFPLLALIPSLLPQALELAYSTVLGIEMRAHAEPFYDWIMALIFILLCAIPYLATLPWQSEEHLDLFRIYRTGSKPMQEGDERT